jgi:hypothetical protein
LAFLHTLSNGSALAEERPPYLALIFASTMAGTYLAVLITYRLRENKQSRDIVGRHRALDTGGKRHKQDGKTNHCYPP